MARISISYNAFLNEYLKDEVKALAYLNELVSAYSDDDEISKRIILKGLGKVAKSHGGFEQLAERIGVDGEKLIDDLTPGSNPRLSTLLSVVDGLGFQFDFKNASPVAQKKIPKMPVKKPVLKRVSLRRKSPVVYDYGETCRIRR